MPNGDIKVAIVLAKCNVQRCIQSHVRRTSLQIRFQLISRWQFFVRLRFFASLKFIADGIAGARSKACQHNFRNTFRPRATVAVLRKYLVSKSTLSNMQFSIDTKDEGKTSCTRRKKAEIWKHRDARHRTNDVTNNSAFGSNFDGDKNHCISSIILHFRLKSCGRWKNGNYSILFSTKAKRVVWCRVQRAKRNRRASSRNRTRKKRQGRKGKKWSERRNELHSKGWRTHAIHNDDTHMILHVSYFFFSFILCRFFFFFSFGRRSLLCVIKNSTLECT